MGPKMGPKVGPKSAQKVVQKMTPKKTEKVQFWGPKMRRPGDPFFILFCIIQETNDGSDDAALDLGFTVISKTSVLPRQN